MADAAPPAGPTPFFSQINGLLDVDVEGEDGQLDQKLTRCEFKEPEVKEPQGDDEWESRDMTADEWDALAFHGEHITLKGYKLTRTFPAPGSRSPPHFTCKELLSTIADFSKEDRMAELTERIAKGMGVDTYHLYFEGLTLEDDGKTYRMCFSS